MKDGPGTLYISSGAPGAVAETTRWIVKGGELRIRHTGSFYGNHSGTTTNLTLDLREGATYYQEQVLNATDSTGISHSPMGPIEMTGAQLVWGPTHYSNSATPEGACAFKGGVTVHASTTDSYMKWPRHSHLNHVNPDCVFNIEDGGRLIVDGVLTNGMAASNWPTMMNCVLTKRGGGELVLLRSNGWTGGTILEGGTITVAADGALGALETVGAVDWTRVWDGATPESFSLFSVAGDVSLGTVRLAPEPMPGQTKVLDWTGDLVNRATWQLQGERAGTLGVTLRESEKSYWIIPVGTLLIIR